MEEDLFKEVEEPKVFSVTELAYALKRLVEGTFGAVKVRGEISGLKRHTSGHVYFAVKDQDSVLNAVCWRGQVSRLKVMPQEGMEVICRGHLTTYPGRSQYQLVVEDVEIAGVGALLKLLQERKERLAKEGLFEVAHKKRLPFLPEVIGVITSPTGAVIRDILHRLSDRFPRRVLLWPVAVQGEEAAGQVVKAIEGFNKFEKGAQVPRPDVIIVARGGGSVEDLWPFNDEAIVRAVYASQIPIISAIGHETDVTLIDYVADLRAPTPTAAAEAAVPVRSELLLMVEEKGNRLLGRLSELLSNRETVLKGLNRGLRHPRILLEEKIQRLDDRNERLSLAFQALIKAFQGRLETLSLSLRHPRETLKEKSQALDYLSHRLEKAGAGVLHNKHTSFKELSRLLESFSYERVLERGFVLVQASDQKPLTHMRNIKQGDPLSLRFQDGVIGATTTKVFLNE